MPKYTSEQIGKAAELACFYVTPTAQWLRMDYTHFADGIFGCTDEETGNGYVFEFSELVDDDVHFEQLVKQVI